jgi:pimeloyl-ACP methyl ester carboxylesterase
LSTSVSRHFATVGETQVHYRRAGRGPAVLLLHQSPSSSAELLPLMQRLAQRFTLIAPDLPGYGASDPFPTAPLSIESLADHVAAFLDELGIDTVAVYGFHTGASVCLSLARRHRRRVSVALCEGLLCLDDAERREFSSRYIEPFVPRFDGAHLAWLWTRIKDQSLFFPWYERRAAARLALDATPVPVLALRACDWLRSGERYCEGYAAAFAYDPRADLPYLEVPLLALCHRHDPLAEHLPRLTPLPASAAVRRFDANEQRLDLIAGALAQHAGSEAAPGVVAARPLASRVWQDYVVSDGTPLRVLRTGTGVGAPLVIQHAAQSSARACRALLDASSGAGRPAIAIELPGHGETDAAAGADLESPEWLADRVGGALEGLGASGSDVVGLGAGAAVGVELARRSPALARSLTLIGALDLTRDPALQAALLASYEAPPPDSHGGFLLRAWHEARDHLLFFPWYERRRAFAVSGSPRLAPAFLQARAVDALLAGAAGVAVRRMELRYPLLARLRELRIVARHAVPTWEPRHAHSRDLAGRAGAGGLGGFGGDGSPREFRTLADDPAHWLRELEPFIHKEEAS